MFLTQKILLRLTKEQEMYLDDKSSKLNKFYNYLLSLYKNKKISIYDLANKEKAYSLVCKIRQEIDYLNEFHYSTLKDVVDRLKKSISAKSLNKELPKEKKNYIKWFSIFITNDVSIVELRKKYIIFHEKNNKEFKYELATGVRKNNMIYNYRILKKYNVYSILLTLDVDLVIPQKNIVTSVAIDPNHKNFLMCADSNGNTFEVKNLSIIKYFFHMTDHMRSLISKTKKGSKRHIYLSKALNRICFKREEQIKKILYKIAHYLTDKYDCIAMGNYRPSLKNAINKNMRRVMLNESLICKFRLILQNVSKKKGVVFKDVNEYGTTKKCFKCGYDEVKDPKIRIYKCPKCGNKYNRDINSAINIGQKGKILSTQDYVGKKLLIPTYTIESNYKSNSLIVTLNQN